MAEVQSPTTERAEKEPEIVAHHDSEEYESAEEVYEEEEEIEEVEVEEEEEVEDEEGTEAAGERDLDDDEDRKNPQFIPKKGYFYEHDDRTQADEEDAEADEKEEVVKEQKPKKTGKEGDRWTHDLYNENEQAGKSKEEIVAIYGYDIRADDTPPKAVRRRRYGRDPRKYSRKSDDAEGNRRPPRGGYRGGRGRRGGSSGNTEHDDRGYEEEFPSLAKTVDRGDSQRDFGRDGRDRDSNRGRSDSRGGRGGGRGGGGGRPPHERPNRAFQNDGERGDGYGYRENKNFGGDRGGRGGGRGRRNEFTNRNRYRDRHENTNESGISGGRPMRNEANLERRDNRYDNRRSEHDDRGGRITNGSSGVDRPRNDPSGSRPAKPSVVAPFTNTEYTGSASLTAQNTTVSSSVPALKSDLHRSLNGTEVEQQKPGDSKSELRRGQSKPFQNDRRSQMPPRLMQQQQQSDQPVAQTGKPKKFSTQRQRQVVDSPVQQTSVPSQMIPQMGPVPTPVVSGSSNMVPSPVPNFTPQQPYFEPGPGNFEAQVYETAGSPMTGSGPSVSPSLWGPHAAAFATAPYPSPPTGTQVQVPQQPYGDPAAMYAATQPAGPTIYAAPPQFIQDPTLLNFAPGPGPQYGAPFHPQGFQGYAPVTPAPPPEVYHAGVTYYNTHNQMQRPPVVAVQKRPKTVLQLVEPPEKVKSGKDTVQPAGGGKPSDFESTSNTISDNGQYGEYESSDAVRPEQADADAELVSKFDNLQTTDKSSELKIEASLNLPPSDSQPESWASQVDQMSPTEKVPPQSLESAIADQANQETSPSSVSASSPAADAPEVSDAKVSSSSKVETEPSSAAGENQKDASSTVSESVAETVKSPEEGTNSQEKASTPDAGAPAQDGVVPEN